MRAILAAALAASAAASVLAAEPWELVLRGQLRHQYKCTLASIVFAREVEIAGRRTFEGRAACVDGREVDFSRAGTHTRFELRLCQPAVC